MPVLYWPISAAALRAGKYAVKVVTAVLSRRQRSEGALDSKNRVYACMRVRYGRDILKIGQMGIE
jgi:6-phosphogluconate dehydrogenase (decarboxylating)